MRSKTPRQRVLYVSAKLYELAAEFSYREFEDMLREGQSQLIRDAISALAALHAAHESPTLFEAPRQSQAPVETPSVLTFLEGLFQDKAAFRTVGEISNVVGFLPRVKESRERYLSRVARLLDNMAFDDRKLFLRELKERLPQQHNNFISKWSKVIGEL